MIRLLIMGRPADEWAQRLRRVVGPPVELDTARLPSAGIRQFESTPPDLVVVADDRGGSRVESLARAIRKRPLGELIPLLVICPLPEDGDVEDRLGELDLLGWYPPESDPKVVADAIAEVLEVDWEELKAKVQSAPDEDHQVVQPDRVPSADGEGASYFGGDLVLEPLDERDDDASAGATNHGATNHGASDDARGEPVTAREIERTLKAVRHEDYFSILQIRRGSQEQSIQRAFQQLYARFDPDSMDFDLVRRYQDEIDEIRDAFEDAFAVLGDPELRQPYLQHTLK